MRWRQLGTRRNDAGRSSRALNGQLATVPVAVLALIAVVEEASAQATRPTHDGKVVLFGNLHAHSSLSDDVDHTGPGMTPAEGFAYAHAHGLDFLAITDHHKATDSPGQPLRLTTAEYQNDLFQVAMDYNAQHAGQFIAIPGIEWGNTSTGNHVNVFGANGLPPDTILNDDYNELYEWAKSNAEFSQFNHPDSWAGGNTAVGNFGEALYHSASAFVSAVDPTVEMISIICTVYKGHLTGPFRDSEDKTHREMQWEKHYKRYLNMGMHLAPGGDQDTHGPNFGTVTAARAAVWAESGSYDDLMKAFRTNRAYATEDDEMAVAFQVRYLGQTYWMGETVPIQGDEADIEVLVKVWQGDGSDGDPTDEGPYTVDVLSDSDGVGGSEAAIFRTTADLPSGANGIIPMRIVQNEYIYLRVTEQGGKDNPIGDGIDEHNNSTGTETPDGNRDDMNDSAWTAPIWFGSATPVTATFVWSVNSNLYHDLDCWAASRIAAANRRTGPRPNAKTKHDCHP